MLAVTTALVLTSFPTNSAFMILAARSFISLSVRGAAGGAVVGGGCLAVAVVIVVGASPLSPPLAVAEVLVEVVVSSY